MLVFSLIFLASCGDDDDDEEEFLIPAIVSVDPIEGEIGDVVTITGTNLTGATSVLFGSTEATITSNTATEIVTSVPDGATSGAITVVTPGGTANSPATFSVVVVGAPVIAEISAYSALPGETITVTGTDFSGITAAQVGGMDVIISNNTEISVDLTIGAGTPLGLSAISLTTDGGTSATVPGDMPFYVIDLLIAAGDDFERDTTVFTGGSPDAEESTAFGWTADAASNVTNDATSLPTPVMGDFFHMEGFSSADISGSYAAQVGGIEVPAGTWSDFVTTDNPQDYWFNVQFNPGPLPDDYEGRLIGLRLRFDGGDARVHLELSQLNTVGYTPDENGWYSVSIPLSEFGQAGSSYTQDGDTWEELPEIGDFQRMAVVVRRGYGTGTNQEGQPLTAADGGVFYALSFDNVFLSKGGPVYPVE